MEDITINNYRLLYVGFIADTILTSAHMFSYGLIQEFTKHRNIELLTLNLQNYRFGSIKHRQHVRAEIEAIGQVDFVICHMLSNIYTHFLYQCLKSITKYEVTAFIEVPIGNWVFDRYFLYMPPQRPLKPYTVYNAPILKQFYHKTTKTPKTILLDHKWKPHAGTPWDQSDQIMAWIEDLAPEYTIYKLMARNEFQNIPSFIRPIRQCEFTEYIKAIADKEVFICTHLGSYNSSAVDMLATSARCLVPRINGRSFIPQYNIELFNLPTFSNKQELLAEINKPNSGYISFREQITKCTDITNVAEDINHQFLTMIAIGK